MSKESFARGFCKIAEAHGIDPVALAKFAQQYKTDGWAPAPVRRIGGDDIPGYAPMARSHDVLVGNNAWAASNPTSIQQALANIVDSVSKPTEAYEDLSHARAQVDPRYRNWLSAHKKALFDAIDESGIPHLRKPDTIDTAKKVYHRSMLDSTGTPARVSAPIKK